MNARQKGLDRVREVRKLLEAMNHIVDGPFYRMHYPHITHEDILGIGDLTSWDGQKFILHQVTDLANKSAHVKTVQAARIPCWIWCRLENKVGYRVFCIDKDGNVEEGEAIFQPRKEKICAVHGAKPVK